MLIVTFGIPGSGSTWVFNVARAISSAAGMTMHCLSADDGLAVLDNLPAVASFVLLKAHSMDLRLLRLVEMADAKFIISLRDHRDSLVSLTERFGISHQAASSDLARSIVSLKMLSDHHPRLILKYENGFIESPDTVAHMASFMGVSLDENSIYSIWKSHAAETIRAIIDNRLAEMPDGMHVHDNITQWHPGHVGDGRIGKWRERLAPDISRAIEAALEPLECGKSGQFIVLKWEAELFSFDPEVSSSNFVTLDGRERVIVFGPYLHLPVGIWKVALRASWSTPLKFDVFSPINDRGVLVETELASYDDRDMAVLTFKHRDHFEPLEIRLRSTEGFFGTVDFEGVDLVQIGGSDLVL